MFANLRPVLGVAGLLESDEAGFRILEALGGELPLENIAHAQG